VGRGARLGLSRLAAPATPGPARGLSGEHIIPVALRPDLAHDPANYTVLCGICNSAKGARVD
jgi:5-methylcytosine-specific restriction endonuclease McrA